MGDPVVLPSEEKLQALRDAIDVVDGVTDDEESWLSTIDFNGSAWKLADTDFNRILQICQELVRLSPKATIDAARKLPANKATDDVER